MNIAFRVDASKKIGTGHVMRCLTLADGLAKHSANICFIAKHMPTNLQKLIQLKGYEFEPLLDDITTNQLDELKHAEWLGTSQHKDAKETIAKLAGQIWDWVIVDHYALDYRWESKLRNLSQKIMVIDDLADRNHDCDVLLDQNFYKDMVTRYVGKTPNNCHLMLGPKYALLREEFSRERESLQIRTGKVKRVLIFFGGVDAQNYTGMVVKVLLGLTEFSSNVDVVIGAEHPSKNEILIDCELKGYSCHIQTEEMAVLMANSDLIIGAGGSATWEKCCLGLPNLAIATADNQIKQLDDLAAAGYCYMVERNNDFIDSFKVHIKAFVENNTLREFLSKNSADLVDGAGTQRTVKFLISSTLLNLRQVTVADEKNLFEWRNQHNIREVSGNKDVIDWKIHQLWFKNMLQNSNIVLLIAEINKTPVGTVRFDINHEQAEVSIYLIQQTESQGLGYNILKSAELWLSRSRPCCKVLNATVLEENISSHKLFKKAGYQLMTTYYKKKLTH